MTNELKNVPELRFTGFEDEWKKKKLDDVANYRRGSFPQPYGNKEWYDEKNGEPFVQVVDVDKNMKLHDQTKQKISDLAKPKSVKGFKGDIVVTLQGSIGRVALLHYDAYIDRTLLLIDSFKIEMNKNYFKYVLYLLFLKEKERAPGGTIKTITKKVLSNFKIDIPNVGEQEKIGEFFSKLDRQIELEEQKLAKLEEQKKGYMQKIFLQELRFKDENGNDYPDWIFEELNNIFTKYQNTIYLHDNEEYKRISISNKGKITHRDITFGKMIGRKRQYLIDLKKHPNTLTFIRQGVFLGGIGFIPSSLDGYIVTENMPLLSMSEEYSKKFMISLFSSESYYKSVIFKNLPTGSAQKALHEKDWLKSFVNIPVYSEQEKIGNFFEKQDNLIKKQSDKVELLKERKKGFLQKMFV
ncbi:restriction endonuclease subunit S [Staphylococcus haemolyticus]|uniref:restriction endonuclease subunit S n=1 Tax=Staphylococcus haemolyticus TaxID=1283 RepID=UPI0034D3C800